MFVLFMNVILYLLSATSSSTAQDVVLQRLNLLEKKYDLLWEENRNLKEEMNFVKNKRLLQGSVVEVSQHKVGFYARFTSGGTLGVNQAIEFNHVHENVGNGYDSRHGHFTAPVNGLYMFSATIYSYDGKDIHCEMVKNGQNIGNVYAPLQGYASSTINAVVTLNVGDMVWVRHLSSTPQELNGGDYSSFSGFIIAQ